MTSAIASRGSTSGLGPARIGLYAFLIVSAAFFLLPLLLVIMNSLKPMEEIRQGNSRCRSIPISTRG